MHKELLNTSIILVRERRSGLSKQCSMKYSIVRQQYISTLTRIIHINSEEMDMAKL